MRDASLTSAQLTSSCLLAAAANWPGAIEVLPGRTNILVLGTDIQHAPTPCTECVYGATGALSPHADDQRESVLFGNFDLKYAGKLVNSELFVCRSR